MWKENYYIIYLKVWKNELYQSIQTDIKYMRWEYGQSTNRLPCYSQKENLFVNNSNIAAYNSWFNNKLENVQDLILNYITLAVRVWMLLLVLVVQNKISSICNILSNK